MHASTDLKPCLPMLRSALQGVHAYHRVVALHACPDLGSAAGSPKRLPHVPAGPVLVDAATSTQLHGRGALDCRITVLGVQEAAFQLATS